MPPYLAQGLSPEEASHLCRTQCRAMCCRGAIILTLRLAEVPILQQRAIEFGVELHVEPRPEGVSWVRFAEHPGDHCPMLDDATSACRIYKERPQRCRDFPEKLVAGCVISGG